MKPWREIAKDNGVSSSNFTNRVEKLGWPKEDAATRPVIRQPSKIIKWRKAAEENGIAYNIFSQRVRVLGWSFEKAATTPVKRIKKRTDHKWIERAKENGIPYDAYRNRVDRLLWTPKDAAMTPVLKNKEAIRRAHDKVQELARARHELINKDPYNLFDVTPQHVEEAERNGVKEGTFFARVYELGWTVLEAINTPTMKGFGKPDGYEEYLQKAKVKGVHQETFRNRVEAGWSLNEASSTQLIRPTDRTRKDKEWVEKAIKNGINYNTYVSRIGRGWTPEEASTTAILESGQHLNEERAENSRRAFSEFSNIKG